MSRVARAREAASRVVARARRAPKPTLLQALIIGGLCVFIGLVGMRAWSLVGELVAIRHARIELEEKRATLEARHVDLERQAQYVQDPDNLETELRTRFNYKKPGESVIVVVSPQGEQE